MFCVPYTYRLSWGDLYAVCIEIIPVEEQDWDSSGKALVQLATGETRSLRKCVAYADVKVCLLLFSSWNGQEQGEQRELVFCLQGIWMQYCHSWSELLKCVAGAVCDCWKKAGFFLTSKCCKHRDPVKSLEQWTVAKITAHLQKHTCMQKMCLHMTKANRYLDYSCVLIRNEAIFCSLWGFFLHPSFLWQSTRYPLKYDYKLGALDVYAVK